MRKGLTATLKLFFSGIILVCVFCVLFRGGARHAADAGDSTKTRAETMDESSGQGNIGQGNIFAESDRLMLCYDQEQKAIWIEDKASAYRWYSTVQDEMYDMESANKTWQANMKSLFILAYTDFKTGKGQISKISSDAASAVRPIDMEENGFSMEYEFEDIGISIKLEFLLQDDTLIARIPEEGIREEKDFIILAVEFMPFFGATANNMEGYIFVPDGSGALVYFIDKAGKSVAGGNRWYVYGPEAVGVREQKDKWTASGVKNFSLPVYGIKNGDNAFIAYITSGDTDAAINLSLSGHAVALNRVFAEFTYRRLYNASRAQLDLRGTKGLSVHDYRAERAMIPGDREIRLTFLKGPSANYSGMARAYRRYLFESGKLKRKNHGLALAIDLFMGITEKQIVFDRYIPMTTFTQAEEIIEIFNSNGVSKMEVNLIGWTSGGYTQYMEQFSVEKRLGGEKGLKKLAGYVRDIEGKLYLQCNFTDAESGTSKFSSRRDTVKQGNGQTVTNEQKNVFLINPAISFKKLTGQLKSFSDMGVAGISFERLGSYIYYDYNKNNPVTRKQTAGFFGKMLETAKNRLGSVAVYGGNAYVLEHADRLLDVPVDCSGYFATDERVPFYQLVVHGSIPYTSQAGNLFYDFERQKLEWVEYGCMPYFALTYEKSHYLKNTDYNWLFASYHGDWVMTASEVFHEFNRRLGNVWGKLMEEHEKLGKDIYRITYEDGSRVYINYSNEDVLVEGYEVKPMDYIVVEKDGGVK